MNAPDPAPRTIRKRDSAPCPPRWLISAAAIGTAISGGVFFDFSFIVMPALAELPPVQGIAAMQALNRSAVAPPLMLLMYGTAALCVVALALAARGRRTACAFWIAAAAVAYLLAAVVVTGAVNVPISAAIDALDPASAGAGVIWESLSTQWVWWNHVRTLTSIAAAAGFAFALRCPSPPSR